VRQREGSAVPFWRRQSWWASTAQAFAALAAASGFGFLASLAAARAMPQQSFGSVILAATVVGSFAALLDFSFEEAVVHFSANAEERHDDAAVLALLRASLQMDLLVGVAVFVALVALAEPIADAVSAGQLQAALIRVAAVEALVMTLNGTTGAALQISGRPHYRAWSMALAGFARLLAVLVAIALSGSPLAVLTAYVVASAVASAVQGVVALRVVRRRWGTARGGRLPVRRRAMASFGLQSSLTTTALALQTGLIAAILGRTAGPAEVAVYDVALFPILLAAMVTAPLRLTSFHEQARLAASGAWSILREALARYTVFALGVGVLASLAGWFLLAPLLPWLYSDRYIDAVGPARILLIAAVAILATGWSKALPAVVGRPGVRTLMTLAELALVGTLVAVLADQGARGAAWATSIAAGTLAIAWCVLAPVLLRPRHTS
jgi:O-antigen/teichoic acid export membrane protein